MKIRAAAWNRVILFLLSSFILSCNTSLSTPDKETTDETPTTTTTTYSVTYNGNGNTSGTVPVDSAAYANGATVTVKGNTGTLAKTGYEWKGWNATADGTGTNYTAGQTLTMGSANMTLYAKWGLPPGTSVWAKSVSTTGSSSSCFYATAPDLSGNVYAVGYQNGTDTYTYGPGVSVTGSNANANAVIVKYDASGNALWAKVAASSAYNAFSDVAVDSSGNAYVVGLQQSATVDYGDGVIGSSGSVATNNAVLVKYSSAGVAQWAKTATTAPSYSEFTGVAVDPAGTYVYAVGLQNNNGTFYYDGNTATGLYSGGGYGENAVLVQFNTSNGNANWARTATAAPLDTHFTAVAADSSGNVFVTGDQSGSGTYNYGSGGVIGSASATVNSVLLKYNSSGTALWAKTPSYNSASYSAYSDVAVDSSGNAYVVGYQYGNYTFTYDGVTVPGLYSGGKNAVLVKYDTSGTAQWGRAATSAGNETIFSKVAVSSAGLVSVAGSQVNSGMFSYDGMTITGTYASGNNAIALTYDSSGTVQWAKCFSSSSGNSSFYGVAAVSGKACFGGMVVGMTAFTDGNATATGGSPAYNTILVQYVQ